MKEYFYRFFIVILTTCLSCEHGPDYLIIEKEVYDTIRPSEYFPAYPGSWWIYNNEEIIRWKMNFLLLFC